jgi:cell division protein FtsB
METIVLQKKVHNLQRTKLRLKNQLNNIIDNLKNENEELKQKNNKLTTELEWISEWDTADK